METPSDGKFFFKLSGSNLDAIKTLKVVCKDSENQFVILDPVLEEEESKESEYCYTFIYDGESETLSYDCTIINGKLKFRSANSSYIL